MITFIVLGVSVVAYGPRVISAYLKEHGYSVRLIFLTLHPRIYDDHLPRQIIDQVVELSRDSQLIALSLMTGYLPYARQISEALRSHLDSPIIWGGTHPTFHPEECLEYADYVCVGEGEDPMLELVRALESSEGRRKLHNIPNIWCREDGAVISNSPRPLAGDLDRFPLPDYGTRDHFFLDDCNLLVPVTRDFVRHNLGHYSVFTSRGCPHSCTFCSNTALKTIYAGKGRFVRKRSTESVLRELEIATKEFGFTTINVHDENFFVRSVKEIEEFAQEYKRRIGLPMHIEVSPQTYDTRKIELLLDAGLQHLNMGIQSANRQTCLDIYNRSLPEEKLSAIFEYAALNTHRLTYTVHFIVCNPWESRESLQDSIRLAGALPQNVKVALYPLVFYPGTVLFDSAMKQGLIEDIIRDVVRKGWSAERLREGDYVHLCFYLLVFLRRQLPPQTARRVLDVMMTEGVPSVLDAPVKAILSATIQPLFQLWRLRHKASRAWRSKRAAHVPRYAQVI